MTVSAGRNFWIWGTPKRESLDQLSVSQNSDDLHYSYILSSVEPAIRSQFQCPPFTVFTLFGISLRARTGATRDAE